MRRSVLAKVAAGQERSLEECRVVHGPLMMRLALALTPTPADAERCVGSMLDSVMERADGFDPSAHSEGVFIAKVARECLERGESALSTGPTRAPHWLHQVRPGCGESAMRPEQQRAIGLMMRERAGSTGGLRLPIVAKRTVREGLVRLRRLTDGSAGGTQGGKP
jgi:hypothetical protein